MAQAAALKDLPGRGGATVGIAPDGSTQEMVVGFWPSHLESSAPDGWLGKLRGAFGAAARVAQRHHEAHQAALIAKASRVELLQPDPSERIKQARAEQKQLDQIREQIAQVSTAAFDRKLKLRHQAIGNPNATPASVMLEQELRAMLRAMPEKDRLDLIENRHGFRMAALRQEPELSGLSPAMHAHYTELEIANRFPTEIAGIGAAMEGAEIAATAAKAAAAAVENELKSVNAPISEPIAPQPSRPWA